jgi:hypothetical protein
VRANPDYIKPSRRSRSFKMRKRRLGFTCGRYGLETVTLLTVLADG